eukprot:g21783.t1
MGGPGHIVGDTRAGYKMGPCPPLALGRGLFGSERGRYFRQGLEDGTSQGWPGLSVKYFFISHTAIKRLFTYRCPSLVVDFLWSDPSQFRISKFFIGYGMGAMFGI